MKNIKYKIKNIIASGTTIFLMATGCATVEEQSNTDEKTKIVL